MASRPRIIALLCSASTDDYADLYAALEGIGVEVIRAADPAETRDLARLDCFALIVVDLDDDTQWPLTLRSLRQQAPGAALVAYSRLPDEHLWIDALEAGAFDFVGKPFHGRDLQWILENALKSLTRRADALASGGSNPLCLGGGFVPR